MTDIGIKGSGNYAVTLAVVKESEKAYRLKYAHEKMEFWLPKKAFEGGQLMEWAEHLFYEKVLEIRDYRAKKQQEYLNKNPDIKRAAHAKHKDAALDKQMDQAIYRDR
jgi:hypothetical protein